MDKYFAMLTAINILVLTFMCMMIIQSESLDSHQKKSFIFTEILIALIAVLEFVSVVAEGMPPKYRIVSIISNFIGFVLTPAVPLFLAYAIAESENYLKAVFVELGYLLISAVTLPFGFIFSVSADNVYSRGPGFIVYLAAFFISIVYLIHCIMLMIRKYQHKGEWGMVLMVIVLVIGVVTQIIYPELHLTWLCVTLLSMLYYIYCCDIWHQIDGLTGLFNQRSYLRRSGKVRHGNRLIVFDVDDFKYINDNYGHLTGDECLKIIAACIRKAYMGHGLCYRIGGDEFCVILTDVRSEEMCSKAFNRIIELRRSSFAILPTVSYGSAKFTVGYSAERVKEEADKNMYVYKKARKQKKAEGLYNKPG